MMVLCMILELLLKEEINYDCSLCVVISVFKKLPLVFLYLLYMVTVGSLLTVSVLVLFAVSIFCPSF